MPFAHANVRVDGVAVPVLAHGDGPPLLYLHAASGPRPTAGLEQLAASRTVLIPAFPGFQGTKPLPSGSRIPELADWLARYLRHAFDGPADIVGHSFGAWVASWLAARDQRQVSRLVLVSPAGLNPEGSDQLEGDPATLLRRAFAHPERRPPETRSPKMIGRNRAAAAAYASGTVWDGEMVSRLRDVTMPTLILYGSEDGVIAPIGPQTLARGIRPSVLRIVEDAAHNIDIDQPEVFADEITQFLQQAQAASA